MKALKWTGIVLGGLIALVIVALLVIPMFIDAEEYKPQIEKMVTDSTGRSFRLGGDLNLSLFPWAGMAISDVHLGNPPGFKERDFVSVKSFEVRAKLLSLLSGQVVIKKFVLDGPRIVVIKDKEGKWNWEGLGKGPKTPTKEKAPPGEGGPSQLPIQSLAVSEFLIKNGSVLFIDQTTGMRKEVQDFRLELKDLSLDKPIRVALSATIDKRPLSLTGTVGPVGQDPGKGTMPIDIRMAALEKVNMKIRGSIQNAASKPNFNVELSLAPFSPKKLMADLGEPLPVTPSDPKALNSVALTVKLKGSPKAVSITDGVLDLDNSKITFTANAQEFEKPKLSFELKVDTIDVDRYLPPEQEEKAISEKKAISSEAKKTNYEPLRRMVLDGNVQIGKLQVKKAKVKDLEMKITARKGLFQLDPFALSIYEGSVNGKAIYDVRKDTPKQTANINAKGIQINPLLKDMFQKDFLEGYFLTELQINMEGKDASEMKRTLNGKGELVFTDGALKGINLTDMAYNVKSAFGAAEEGSPKARTDFSEIRIPFTATNGVVQISEANMVTPLMRLVATGKANLVQESIDFKVVPKGVATLKGKGDTKERSGIMVPILVSGTFKSPKFRPDLEGIAKQQLEKRLEDVLKDKKGEDSSSSEGMVKDLMKKLPFGK